TDTLPWRNAVMSCTVCIACCVCCSISVAYSMNARPATVMVTERVVRSKRRAPTWASRRAIRAERADCVRCSCRAACPKLQVWLNARKALRSRVERLISTETREQSLNLDVRFLDEVHPLVVFLDDGLRGVFRCGVGGECTLREQGILHFLFVQNLLQCIVQLPDHGFGRAGGCGKREHWTDVEIRPASLGSSRYVR